MHLGPLDDVEQVFVDITPMRIVMMVVTMLLIFLAVTPRSFSSSFADPLRR